MSSGDFCKSERNATERVKATTRSKMPGGSTMMGERMWPDSLLEYRLPTHDADLVIARAPCCQRCGTSSAAVSTSSWRCPTKRAARHARRLVTSATEGNPDRRDVPADEGSSLHPHNVVSGRARESRTGLMSLVVGLCPSTGIQPGNRARAPGAHRTT